MPLYNPLAFINESEKVPPVFNTEEIPKELNIFYRQAKAFLPEGKTFSDLTPEELKKVKSQYRFDPMRPGIPQTISGFGHMV